MAQFIFGFAVGLTIGSLYWYWFWICVIDRHLEMAEISHSDWLREQVESHDESGEEWKNL